MDKKQVADWHQSLLQRCANSSECQDFPHRDLEERFTTSDTNGRLPPAQELTEFVLTHFGERNQSALGEEAHQGAERLIRESIKAYDGRLSPWDAARLHSSHAVILRQLAFTGEGARYSGEAVAAFRRALSILKTNNLSLRLRRHLAWLAADTLFGSRRASSNTDTLVELLAVAASGDPETATPGLYFGCLTRAFTLPDVDFSRFTAAIRDDLYRAWTLLPMAVLSESRAETPTTHKVELGGHPQFGQLSALFGSASQSDAVAPDNNVVAFETDLVWRPEDRLAVCATLHRASLSEECRSNYAFEAKALRLRLPERCITHRSEELIAYVDNLSAVAPIMSDGYSFEEAAGSEVQSLLRQGLVSEAISQLRSQIVTESDANLQIYLRMQCAKLEGDSRSAKSEQDELAELIDHLSTRQDREAFYFCGHAHRMLALSLWNTQLDEAALDHIRLGAIATGAAANPKLALQILKLESAIRASLGVPKSEKMHNGHVRAEASLWNQPGYNGYSVKDAQLDFGENPGDQSDIRSLRKLVYHLRASERTPHELEHIVRTIITTDPGEDKLPWCSVLYNVWVRMSGRAKHLSEPFVLRLRIETATELLRVFFDFLPAVRGRRLQSDIAELLGSWLIEHQGRITAELTEQITRALYVAAENERQRVEKITREQYLPGPREKLRKLLSWLGRARCFECDSFSLSDIVDACKTMDADDLAGTAEADTDDSDPLATLEPEVPPICAPRIGESENAQSRFGDVCDEPDASQSVVTFFLADSANQETDGSFVVLRTGGREQVFSLPEAIRRLKEFRELVLGACRRGQGKGFKPGFAKSLDFLRSKCGSEVDARMIASFWNAATLLGNALFPKELMAALQGIGRLLLVPHGHLFSLPLHLLPTDGGSRLIDSHVVSYWPKLAGAWKSVLTEDHRGSLLCVNVEDEHILPATERIIANLAGQPNVWHHEFRPSELLDLTAACGTGIFFVHGHTCFTSRMSHRIALRNGVRVTMLDVLLTGASFANSDIFLIACHSADPHIKRSREMLGLASAFLRRNARSVLACLWRCQTEDAADLLLQMLASQDNEQSLPTKFREALVHSSASCTLPEAFLRFGCFMPYAR